MRCKEVMDTAEYLEKIAEDSKYLCWGLCSDAEVPIRAPEDRALLFFMELVWGMHPEVKK